MELKEDEKKGPAGVGEGEIGNESEREREGGRRGLVKNGYPAREDSLEVRPSNVTLLRKASKRHNPGPRVVFACSLAHSSWIYTLLPFSFVMCVPRVENFWSKNELNHFYQEFLTEISLNVGSGVKVKVLNRDLIRYDMWRSYWYHINHFHP